MNLKPVADYYAAALAHHGPTPQGVDWNSEASQLLRFLQLTRLWSHLGDPQSINDYGCGFGALLDYLRARGFKGEYAGFDMVPQMLSMARARHAPDARVTFVSAYENLQPADYTVASGIFNVKLDAEVADWHGYVLETLDRLRDVSIMGFAFNLLTLCSDPERRRSHLYYADASEFLRHCQNRYSRHVAVLHDYPLYEFTVLVRLHTG